MKTISYDAMSAFQSQYAAASYREVNEFLASLVQENNAAASNDEKIIYLITGGVAAGKSTFAYGFIKYFNLRNLPYVGTDSLYNCKFAGVSSFDEDYDNARRYTIDVLQDYVSRGVSFVWETVLSKRDKLEFIAKCKKHGYKIVCIFICTENPDVAAKRSSARYLQGGNNVDVDFINDRYVKSLSLTKRAQKYFDVVVAFDNTSNLTMAYYRDGNTTYQAEETPNWFKRFK